MTKDSSKLIFQVLRTIREHHLINIGDTLIVAISGGADSTALFDLLLNLPGYNLHLIAAHLNHCLRGSESDADEEFCRVMAQKNLIPFEIRRVDIKAVVKSSGLNLEDAARQARINFLDEISKKYNAAAVAVAHHSDDQAETVLMRLLRGSGMTGLSGMAYRNDRGYIRPLLDISHSEIEIYLREVDISWREDASNIDTAYLRNRIRHELLPLLKTYNPAIRSSLLSTAAIIGGDDELLEDMTLHAFEATSSLIDGRIDCDVDLLRDLKPALLRRVLRHAFKKLVGNLQGVNFSHIESLCKLIASDRPNAKLSLPQKITAIRAYNKMSFIVKEDKIPATDFDIKITAPGCYQLPDSGCIVVELSDGLDFSADLGSVQINLHKLPFPWNLRSFTPGDRIQPFGMQGTKKVKNIFIDRKIPASLRRNIPLLFCDDDLIWIAGVCSSELTRINEQVSKSVKVTWYNFTTKKEG